MHSLSSRKDNIDNLLQGVGEYPDLLFYASGIATAFQKLVGRFAAIDMIARAAVASWLWFFYIACDGLGYSTKGL